MTIFHFLNKNFISIHICYCTLRSSLCAILKCWAFLWREIKLATWFEDDPKAPFSRAMFHSLILTVLSAKQGGIKYHFFSLWYDSTWWLNPGPRTIGKLSTHYTNGPVLIIHITSCPVLTFFLLNLWCSSYFGFLPCSKFLMIPAI